MRGDLESAEAAYQRADDAATPTALNLGMLLHERGDLEAARGSVGGARVSGQRATSNQNTEVAEFTPRALRDLGR
jgi:hypothetical protein